MDEAAGFLYYLVPECADQDDPGDIHYFQINWADVDPEILKKVQLGALYIQYKVIPDNEYFQPKPLSPEEKATVKENVDAALNTPKTKTTLSKILMESQIAHLKSMQDGQIKAQNQWTKTWFDEDLV